MLERCRAAILVLVALALAACGAEDGPWLAFDGGGFVFNYRTAEASYGFNVRPLRYLAPGTVLEAELENPAGGPPIVIDQEIRTPGLRYTFQSPPLTGIQAGKPYHASVSVLEAGSGKRLARYERAFTSQADQSWLPEKPLVVGPGYQPNPEAAQ